MKVLYEYNKAYFEGLTASNAKERGDMHASYLLNALDLGPHGKATLAEFLLAAGSGVASRSKNMAIPKPAESKPKFKLKARKGLF